METREKDVVIKSWNELTDRLYEHAWNEGLGRYRSDFVFRGHSDSRHDLSTSLARLGGDYAKMERHLLRNFIKYAGNELGAEESEWHWLGLGQHHGLPTRLLDWSYSPYVAMHFATARTDLFDRDGAIWCVNFVKAHELVPQKLREILTDEGANAFTSGMLGRAIDNHVANLDKLAKEPFVLFYEPLSLDQRIVNQYALFSIMNDASASLDDWLADHPDLFYRVVIPAALKWEIRDKLDQANITERTLFPNLDGLSAWLARQYSPRKRDKPLDKSRDQDEQAPDPKRQERGLDSR